MANSSFPLKLSVQTWPRRAHGKNSHHTQIKRTRSGIPWPVASPLDTSVGLYRWTANPSPWAGLVKDPYPPLSIPSPHSADEVRPLSHRAGSRPAVQHGWELHFSIFSPQPVDGYWNLTGLLCTWVYQIPSLSFCSVQLSLSAFLI